MLFYRKLADDIDKYEKQKTFDSQTKKKYTYFIQASMFKLPSKSDQLTENNVLLKA